jgi:CDP-diglyceride synthetase
MSPRYRPPGKTFKERWPHEVEETRYFASTSYAVVIGGVLGVLLVPLAIWDAASAAPLAAAGIVLGLLGITATLLGVATPGRRRLALIWKSGAWLLGAAVLGLVVESIAMAFCGDLCGTAAAGRRPSPLLTYLPLVAGSIAIAYLADRAGNALRRRAPSPVAPR